MKKMFKALAIAAASTTLCAGIAMATGCNVGTNGKYVGEYHYWGEHGGNYGIMVEVTVENNIITNITDITNKDTSKQSGWKEEGDKVVAVANGVTWTSVSAGWENYAAATEGGALGYTYWAYPGVDFSGMSDDEKLAYVNEHPLSWYNWTNDNASNWTKHENWLLQQYVGLSVADVKDIKVYYNSYGEPYAVRGGYNVNLDGSGLLISGATQGSGRLLLAVQDALSK